MVKPVENMPKIIRYATLLFTTTIIILSLFLISLISQGEPGVLENPYREADITVNTAGQSESADPPDNNFIRTEPTYTVYLRESELRLVSSEDPSLYTVLDEIDPRTMRESDRLSLSSGIELSSYEDLVSFLEDFGS